MNSHSYVEIIDGERIYVAVLNSSKCKTNSGFLKEVIMVFSLPENCHYYDISAYLSYWFREFKTIKVILSNSGSLRKNDSRFNEVITAINSWKNDWEIISPQNEFIIEV
jgi:hypothetical protein